MNDYIERILQVYRDGMQIKCPHCGTIQPNDDYQYPVSYWGEDGPIEWTCTECEKKFWVEEYVSRSYTVGKTLDTSGYIVEEQE